MFKSVKVYRVIKGVTQTDVARAIGIDTSAYCLKENGKREFTLSEAKKLADYFGVSIENLFFGKEVQVS